LARIALRRTPLADRAVAFERESEPVWYLLCVKRAGTRISGDAQLTGPAKSSTRPRQAGLVMMNPYCQ